MAAVPSPYYGTTGLTHYDYVQWTIPPSDHKTVYAEQFTALAKQRKREARAERDRQVIQGIARMQATFARTEIQARRPFLRIVGKRLTERARRRGRG